jgi:hypothetical protein
VGALTTNDGFLARFEDPMSGRAVILEDDNRVAYAYLMMGETIVSDVWLYNVAAAPDTPEWSDASKMPFLNPSVYCSKDASLPRLNKEVVVECAWTDAAVDVFLNDILAARLAEGAKPGWSRLAIKKGPLALPLQ